MAQDGGSGENTLFVGLLSIFVWRTTLHFWLFPSSDSLVTAGFFFRTFPKYNLKITLLGKKEISLKETLLLVPTSSCLGKHNEFKWGRNKNEGRTMKNLTTF